MTECISSLKPGQIIYMTSCGGMTADTIPYSRTLFPRSEASKVYRMDRLVDWKRRKIRERTVRHLWIGAVVLLGTPLAIALLAGAWRVAILSVLS